MVRVYMVLWPFVMIFVSSLLILAVFTYKWDVAGAENMQEGFGSFSPPRQQSNWMTDESFNKLEWNYGVIVDAGSSGSRLFVYVWPPHSGDPHDLIKIRPLLDNQKNPVVKKVSPGLSSFGESPENATMHMRTLLDYAVEHIPIVKHKETSLFVMATAGLRLIPEKQSSAILANLRSQLPKFYDFIILDQHIEMISGKWEGIYSWIAVNYVLGRLGHENNENTELVSVRDEEEKKTIRRPKTVGMIDMGGGSVQIAFELTSGWEKIPRTEEHLVHTVNLGCSEHDSEHTYRLYVATFLGFGANSAMKRYEEFLTKDANRTLLNGWVPGTIVTVNDDCLNLDMTKTVHVDASGGAGISPSSLVYQRKGMGRWSECVDKLKQFLEKEKCEKVEVCSMAGTFQPEINLASSIFYGFSEFWYSFQDVLGLGGAYSYDNLKKEATDFCKTEWSVVLERKRKNLYEKADKFRLRNQCFKSAWAVAVLHEGFGFSKSWINFKTVSTINNQEVQWTLGAMLYKLRYFPLGDIQRLREMERKTTLSHFNSAWFSSAGSSQLILLLCMAVVVFAGLRYCAVLRRSAKSGLPRNRSLWGYMMLDSTDMPTLEGIRTEKAHYVM